MVHAAPPGGVARCPVKRRRGASRARSLAHVAHPADGETARDVAERRGHDGLVPFLSPRAVTRARAETLPLLDAHLQEVVGSRLRGRLDVRLRPVVTSVLTEWADEPLWFPIPGMYGGFSVRLLRNYLYVESWSRVVGGSGQAHVVTHAGYTLVDDGFV